MTDDDDNDGRACAWNCGLVAELGVDYWTAAVVASSQRPCCMSAPALYDYYRTSAAAVKEALNPRKWFLSMDEIRDGQRPCESAAKMTAPHMVATSCGPPAGGSAGVNTMGLHEQ